jgi:hypothetical protein
MGDIGEYVKCNITAVEKITLPFVLRLTSWDLMLVTGGHQNYKHGQSPGKKYFEF